MTPFTSSDVVTQVMALAQENPRTVYRPPTPYDACSYVTGRDGAGCIVGQALVRLGVPEEVLYDAEHRLVEEGGGTGVAEMFAVLEVSDYADDLVWLAETQRLQDVGTPWGEAVAH